MIPEIDFEFKQTKYISESVSELALDSLRTDDCLILTTINATYCFLIVDPARKSGLLSGGVLGRDSIPAVLLGGEVPKNGYVATFFEKLCEGSRAIFFLASADQVHQLVTSTITRLVYARANVSQYA